MVSGAVAAAACAGWWSDTLRRANQPPAAPRVPLALAASGVVVGSVEPALAARIAAAGLPLGEGAAGWVIQGEPSGALAQIAQWLHGQGLSNGWRHELLDVTDAQGRSHAHVERAVVRPLGIATHALHLMALDGAGGMWVQQRAFDKPTDPGLWDTTMGGLRAAGESPDDTLWRETWEEAGLRPGQVHQLVRPAPCSVRRPLAHGYMVEHIDGVVCTLAAGVVPVNRDGEVARFECWSRAQLVSRLLADAFTLEAAVVLGRWLESQGQPGFSRPADPSAGFR